MGGGVGTGSRANPDRERDFQIHLGTFGRVVFLVIAVVPEIEVGGHMPVVVYVMAVDGRGNPFLVVGELVGNSQAEDVQLPVGLPVEADPVTVRPYFRSPLIRIFGIPVEVSADVVIVHPGPDAGNPDRVLVFPGVPIWHHRVVQAGHRHRGKFHVQGEKGVLETQVAEFHPCQEGRQTLVVVTYPEVEGIGRGFVQVDDQDGPVGTRRVLFELVADRTEHIGPVQAVNPVGDVGEFDPFVRFHLQELVHVS